MLLKQMEQNSLLVSNATLPYNIPMLDLMAEHGPFDDEKENGRFKKDQQDYVKKFCNSKLKFVKNSSHNIVNDKPDLVIKQIVNFYKILEHH